MNKTLKTLLIVGLMAFGAEGLLVPIYAVFVQQIGGSLLDAGGAMAVFAIVSGLLIIIFGKIADKANRELMIFIGFGIGTAATAGYLLVSTPLHLFIVQLFLGIGAAFSIAAWDGLYVKNLGQGKESSQWGYFDGGYQIVLGVAAIGGAAIATSFGFKTLFIVMTSVLFAATVMAFWLYKKSLNSN